MGRPLVRAWTAHLDQIHRDLLCALLHSVAEQAFDEAIQIVTAQDPACACGRKLLRAAIRAPSLVRGDQV
jgi:hypothetical protein